MTVTNLGTNAARSAVQEASIYVFPGLVPAGGVGALRAAVREIGSILTLPSGRPGYPYGNQGRNTPGFLLGERVGATGQALRLPAGQRSTERWFNSQAFVLQPYGAIGTAGGKTILGPGGIDAADPAWAETVVLIL